MGRLRPSQARRKLLLEADDFQSSVLPDIQRHTAESKGCKAIDNKRTGRMHRQELAIELSAGTRPQISLKIRQANAWYEVVLRSCHIPALINWNVRVRV